MPRGSTSGLQSGLVAPAPSSRLPRAPSAAAAAAAAATPESAQLPSAGPDTGHRGPPPAKVAAGQNAPQLLEGLSQSSAREQPAQPQGEGKPPRRSSGSGTAAPRPHWQDPEGSLGAGGATHLPSQQPGSTGPAAQSIGDDTARVPNGAAKAGDTVGPLELPVIDAAAAERLKPVGAKAGVRCGRLQPRTAPRPQRVTMSLAFKRWRAGWQMAQTAAPPGSQQPGPTGRLRPRRQASLQARPRCRARTRTTGLRTDTVVRAWLLLLLLLLLLLAWISRAHHHHSCRQSPNVLGRQSRSDISELAGITLLGADLTPGSTGMRSKAFNTAFGKPSRLPSRQLDDSVKSGCFCFMR